MIRVYDEAGNVIETHEEVYAWRGETDKAFEWLQISLDNHDTGLLTLYIDPLLQRLHSDQRFAMLIKKIGLPQSD